MPQGSRVIDGLAQPDPIPIGDVIAFDPLAEGAGALQHPSPAALFAIE